MQLESQIFEANTFLNHEISRATWFRNDCPLSSVSVKIVGLKKLQDLRVKYKNHVNHVEVSLKYDYPKNAGWFIEGKPTIKWMMIAGLPMDWKPKTLCKP